MTSKAQKEAINRYFAKQGRIDIRPPADLVEKAKAHAKSRGESLSGFVIRAIRETMERDN